jgi:hypothetical protein
LAWKDAGAEPVHYANQVPTGREGQPWSLGMNALARHDVGQGDARGQHSYPHFTALGLGALFFNHPKFLGPAVMTDEDARLSHGTPLCAFWWSLGPLLFGSWARSGTKTNRSNIVLFCLT